MCDGTPLGTLEEYAELRQEIRTYLSRRAQSKNFLFMIALAIVGLDAASAVNFGTLLFPVSAALVWFLWFDEVRRIQAVFRTGTYIEVFIEPVVPGLNWETLGRKQPVQTSWIPRIIANAEFPTMFIGLTWLSWLKADGGRGWMAELLLLLALVLLVSLSVHALQVARHGRENERARWQGIRAAGSPSSARSLSGRLDQVD